MNLLFITRKYPPAVGGMEHVSYALSTELTKIMPVTLITWGGSQKWLPYFLPKAFIVGLFSVYRKQITHIYLGDALLAPLGLALQLLTRKKLSVTIHGLDITYRNKLYQAVIPFCLNRLDVRVCISAITRDQCIKRDVTDTNTHVIPWGIYKDEYAIDASRQQLEALLSISLHNKKVIVTVGRLVKRKGVAWFIANVLVHMDASYVYVVIGGGPDETQIRDLIVKHDLSNRVILLGKAPSNDLKIVLNTADIFLMPNIAVRDDIEGYGIVAIEAASVGIPIIMANIDGLIDAASHIDNAVTYEQGNAQALLDCFAIPLQKTNVDTTWEYIGRQYAAAIDV